MSAADARLNAVEAWARLAESLHVPRAECLALIESHPAPDRALSWYFLWLLLDGQNGLQRWAAETPLRRAVETAALAVWRQLLERDAQPQRDVVYRAAASAEDQHWRGCRWIAHALLEVLRSDASSTAWAVRAAAKEETARVAGAPHDEAMRYACLRLQRHAALEHLRTGFDDGPWPRALTDDPHEAAVAAQFADWLAERNDIRAGVLVPLVSLLGESPAG